MEVRDILTGLALVLGVLLLVLIAVIIAVGVLITRVAKRFSNISGMSKGISTDLLSVGAGFTRIGRPILIARQVWLVSRKLMNKSKG